MTHCACTPSHGRERLRLGPCLLRQVTDIEPDMKVRAAMNEINAAQRMRCGVPSLPIPLPLIVPLPFWHDQ